MRVREPRRRFGMAAYRSEVMRSEDQAAGAGDDPDVEPGGFVVLVEPGDRVHFLDWGGPGRRAIVLVHALAGSAWAWTPVARRLREARRTVAMDLRGHGLSDAPTGPGAHELAILASDVFAVAEGSGALEMAPRAGVVLAGHGFGAIIAA